MDPTEQKNGLFLEEKRVVFCPFAAQERVKHAEDRMGFWLRIAAQERIDVDPDKQRFEEFYRRFKNKIFRQSNDYVGLLLLEGCICLTLDKVAKRVRENIRRVPSVNILEELGRELETVTKKCCVWLKIAKEENVSFEEEQNIIFQSQMTSHETLKDEHLNLENIREINKRRLVVIRRFVACNLIRRVYSQRISKLAQMGIHKFKGTEHEEVALGIVKEALEGLPCGSEITKVEMGCENVFELFKANIQLLLEDPEKYHLLADLEMIRRQAEQRIHGLMIRAKGDSKKMERIGELKSGISYALSTEDDSEKLIRNINRAIDQLEKILFGENQHSGCGFLNDK